MPCQRLSIGQRMKDSACVCLAHLSRCELKGGRGYLHKGSVLPRGTSECQGHTHGRDSAAQVPGESSCGIRIGATVSAPSHLGVGGAAFVRAHVCVQIHLPSPLNHSLECREDVPPCLSHWPKKGQPPSPCKLQAP